MNWEIPLFWKSWEIGIIWDNEVSLGNHVGMGEDSGQSATGRKSSFPPVVCQSCRVLVLGSLPGEESLRQAQYYAHPRNAFWPMMAELCGFELSLPYGERLSCLLKAGIALWDVVGSGRRQGSLDQNIQDETPNDIEALLEGLPELELICCNGGASFRYLRRYFPQLWQQGRLRIRQLPSTSPAAARWTYGQKREAWAQALASCGM